MFTNCPKTLVLSITFAVASLVSTISAAGTVQLGLVPNPAEVRPGDTAFVDVIGSYDETDSILGGAVDLSFRADLFEVVSIELTAPQDVAGSTGLVFTSGSEGWVRGIAFATFIGVTSSFEVATIEFRAIAGSGQGSIAVLDSLDPVFLWVNEGFDLVEVVGATSVLQISAVPEPQTTLMWLLGAAAMAAIHSRGGMARRRVS